MDMMFIRVSLKYIKWISIVLISAYALLPLINGLGCNGTYDSKNHDIEFISTCRMGIVKTFVWNKISGQMKMYTSVLAKKGDSVICFVINSKELAKPVNGFTRDNFNVLRDAPIIWSAKLEHTRENNFALVGAPSYIIYETDISGRLGFW